MGLTFSQDRPTCLHSAVALFLAVLLLSGCIGAIDYGPRSARARNDTEVTLEIYIRNPMSPRLLATVDPGTEVELYISFGPGDCTGRDLVAETADGVEVERRPGPICEDDLWVVDGEPD